MVATIFLFAFVVLIFVIILVFNTKEDQLGKEVVCLDNSCYKVIGEFPDKTKAAETLEILDNFAKKMLEILNKKYLQSKLRDAIIFLNNNYRSDSLVENLPNSTKNTSFVENKGEVFAVCLRQNGEIHNMHTLQFVVLHEMAHLMTKGYGHESDFWQNFKFLLNEAKEGGIHIPKNYGRNNAKYCGLNIYYNPFYDDAVKDIRI